MVRGLGLGDVLLSMNTPCVEGARRVSHIGGEVVQLGLTLVTDQRLLRVSFFE